MRSISSDFTTFGVAMARVTSTEANRRFSELLAKVRGGEPAEITVRGEVVAKLVPVKTTSRANELKKQKEFEAFLERLKQRPVMNLPRATRDEIYER
jgi:prevent-host-death family protein